MATPPVTIRPAGAGTVSFEEVFSLYGSPDYRTQNFQYERYNQRIGFTVEGHDYDFHCDNDIEFYIATATPNSGYVFDHWESHEYYHRSDSGTVIDDTYTATANPLFNVGGWSTASDLGIGHFNYDFYWIYYPEHPHIVQTLETVSMVAVFKRIATINSSASVSPSIASTEGCTATASPQTQSGIEGESATITFTATAAQGWRFTSWSDGSTDATHQVTETFGPDATKTVSRTANFERTDPYVINGEASVTPSAAATAGCTATATPQTQTGSSGTTATITFAATPVRGWGFERWVGGSLSPSITVEETFGPEQTKTVSRTAYFYAKEAYYIYAAGDVDPYDAYRAGCRATASPSGSEGYIGESATITFTAVASQGWEFVSWSDGSTDAVHSMSVDFGPGEDESHDKWVELTATFQRKQKLTVTVSTSPANAGTSTGGGEYDPNAHCTIGTSAHCSPWTFDHWTLSPGGTISTQSHTFTVTQDTECVAHYTHSDTEMPYDDGNGNILCSSDDEILYDGNLVSA